MNLDSVAKSMLADLEASGAFRHRGSKGTVRELNLLKDYLTKYLPGSVTAVHSREAIAVDGEVSAQCDIMIIHPSTPPLWSEDNYRVVPIECLYGVIEVKSFLDSTRLRDAWKKIARIKRMPKKAFQSNPLTPFARTRTVYGQEWSYVPTCGLVFAYNGADLRTLGTTLVRLAEAEGEDNPEFFIDSVWVLNKGGLVWLNPDNGRIDASPMPAASLQSLDADPGQVLINVTLAMHEHFGTAWMPEFRIKDYFGQAAIGTLGLKWDFEASNDRANPDNSRGESA